MKEQDYTESITVNATALEAFNSINNVTKWWTENLEGSSQKTGDVFSVRFGDVHASTQKILEQIPAKKIVWLVTESRLNFLQNKQEWNGTRICFDIFEKDNTTQVRFTHHGLVPGIQCYKDCSNAWGGYIRESLRSLITTGTGQPTTRETALQ